MFYATSEIFNFLVDIFKEATYDGWLGFLGSIFGAVATIAAVIITIKNDSKRLKKNDILKSKPWITSKIDLLIKTEQIENAKKEKSIYVYLIDKEHLTWVNDKKPPYYIDGLDEFKRDECVVKYEIKNVGGNTATYLNFSINNDIVIPQFALSVGDERNLVLILPLINNKDTEYKLKLEYGDVVSDTKYYQQEAFIVKKTNSGTTISQKIENQISAPQVLNKEQKNISKLKQWIYSKLKARKK